MRSLSVVGRRRYVLSVCLLGTKDTSRNKKSSWFPFFCFVQKTKKQETARFFVFLFCAIKQKIKKRPVFSFFRFHTKNDNSTRYFVLLVGGALKSDSDVPFTIKLLWQAWRTGLSVHRLHLFQISASGVHSTGFTQKLSIYWLREGGLFSGYKSYILIRKNTSMVSKLNI